jgi:hypothetical protein
MRAAWRRGWWCGRSTRTSSGRDTAAATAAVRIAVQRAPLGTGHAAMVGMEHASGTCIVANGDDLYGRRSLELAVEHAMEGISDEHALVAFDLARTPFAPWPGEPSGVPQEPLPLARDH